MVVLQGEGEKAGIQEIKNDVHFLGNVRRRDIQKQICNVILSLGAEKRAMKKWNVEVQEIENSTYFKSTARWEVFINKMYVILCGGTEATDGNI